ncbi:MAG: nucleotidyltransferase [Deltaproteobacteria bacterium]|nr:nucleotidyltransferase [Deltaproteobacteria bacterium]
MNPTLVVLAAGIGSRYKGLKQIDPLGPCGETIIDYSVFDAVRSGFNKTVFVIRRDIEESFKEAISKKFENRVQVEYAYQELDMLPEGYQASPGRSKPWGTAHAVLVTEDLISTPFAVINADDFYGLKGFQLLGEYLEAVQDNASTDYAMVGYVLRNTLSEFGTVSRGVCQCDHQGFMQGITEIISIEKDGHGARYVDPEGKKRLLSGDEVVSMNMWGFTPSLFGHLRGQFSRFLEEWGGNEKAEFLLPDTVHALVKEGQARVKVLHTQKRPLGAASGESETEALEAQKQWFGLTHQKDRSAAVKKIQALIRLGVYPEKLWS